MRKQISNSQRVVIKVGSALVTNNGAGLAFDFIDSLASQMAALRSQGKQVILVTSGAIAAGMQRLGWATRPHSIHELQAAAAVGQMGLATVYEGAFMKHQINTAQILLTHDDLADRTRYLNARSTLQALLQLNVVPIINENDTVVTDEIKFGDNDTLGALVANLIEAETLIILTDQQGLYSADPRSNPNAVFIHEGRADDRQYESMAGGAGSGISKGGMITKIKAAQRAARSGAHTVIASGRETNVLPRLMSGEQLGTLLYATSTPLAARKQWLADHLQLAGSVTLDAGAVSALKSGKSLLPVGVKDVAGEFERGAAIACRDIEGKEIARGLANYSSSESRRIAGHSSDAIEQLLGYVDEEVLIHRDNLILL
ncbi:MAG TPA: glutamate 5-kinase [Rhodocyclaceae bacterium]|nr:glutamate 5-kinase [Rhodocyclaceae bacterium]